VLGTFTPLGERGRRGSFARTAALYFAASTAAASLLGLVIEKVTALALAGAGIEGVIVLWLAAALAASALVVDLTGQTSRLPYLHRQVSELWVGHLRPTVYALGFGGQLGLAFTTHVVTAATYAAFFYAALTGNGVLAATVGAAFGATRGALVLLAAPAHDAESMARIHRRAHRLERPLRLALRAVDGAVALALTVLAIMS
jgi:hypothetical protein